MWRRARGAAAPPRARAIACLLVGIAAACAGPQPDGAGAASPGVAAAPSAPSTDDRLIIVVRHAEKVDDSRDPELSEAGAARAASLAVLLADANIERVLSSDYVRTRATAAPLASAAGAEVEVYDPRDIPRLARLLLDAPERAILVVGHSNTTPALVAELTGEPADSMPEDEYDRLYRVYVRPDGRVFAEVSRY